MNFFIEYIYVHMYSENKKYTYIKHLFGLCYSHIPETDCQQVDDKQFGQSGNVDRLNPTSAPIKLISFDLPNHQS